MNKVLLVFGPGFLGKEIVKLAKEQGICVYAASRNGGEAIDVADLDDIDSLKALREKYNPDYVIHCAASGRSADRIASYTSVYKNGCENVSKVFTQTKILFTSSTSVYAQTDRSIVTEESETLPSSATAKILLEAESAILDAGGTVARLSGIYGQGRSYMIKRLLAGDAAIEGDGQRLLNHIHHVDAARACLFLLDQASGIYNVTDSVCLSQKETYEKLCEKLNLPMPPQMDASESPVSKRGFSDKCISNKKLIELGWQPNYPCFAEAAREIVDSVRT